MNYLYSLLAIIVALSVVNAVAVAPVSLHKRQAGTGSCSTIRIRKEWRDLTRKERSDFTDAWILMKNNSTYFDDLSKWHGDFFSGIHNNAFLFPAHRRMINLLEDAIRAFNPEVSFPYWDWSLDASDPYNAVIFDTFGKTRPGSCFSNGAFVNWTATNPDPHCVVRDWTAATAGTLTDFMVLKDILNTSATFPRYREDIEYAHNLVHGAIMGDMGYQYSPNDPIFYMHHAFIDKLWWDFQEKNSFSLQSIRGDVDEFGEPVTEANEIPGYPNVTISDVLDTTQACFTYAQPRAGVARFAKESSKLQTLPPLPKPLSPKAAMHFGLSPEEVKQRHERLKERYEEVQKLLKKGKLPF